MKAVSRKPRPPGSLLAMSLLAALVLTACGASFEEGAYADPRSGTTYEFGPNGQGRLVGGVAGTPSFTYQVESDQIVVSYGKNQPDAAFKRIDEKTLERHDGTRLKLKESPQ